MAVSHSRPSPSTPRVLLSAACGLLVFALPAGAQDDWQAGLFTPARQLPLVSQALTVHVAGGEAAVELIQVFANDGDGVAQADYRLHLPEETVVSGFGFWSAGRFLAAELKEKEQARQAHGAAAAGGRATGLLEREGTMHSFSVYPIPAGELQQVETTLRLPVATERGRSHLRLPIDAFLGHATVTSTAIVHLASDEPLAAFGVDGATPETLDRGEREARLAFTADRPVEVWWSEEAPPLLTRAEAVPLDHGDFALQVRVVLNDAGADDPAPSELVLLVDTSFSMRRRAKAIADFVQRVRDQAAVRVRVVSVAETAVELDGSGRELTRRLFSGEAGFHGRWDELAAAAVAAGCPDPGVRCVAVTDPQLDGLPGPGERRPEFEILFLADADELAYFAATLGPQARVYQPGVEPRARLDAQADELVLPVLEVTAIDQRGGTFELLNGGGPPRVAEGGLLRLAGSSRSTEPLELRLAIGDRQLTRTAELEMLAPESRQGRAVRRGFYRRQLESWTADYRRGRDPDLKRQIVDVSVREGIPTELTALHVAEPEGIVRGALPRTATPAALLRVLGLALLLAAGALRRLAGRR